MSCGMCCYESHLCLHGIAYASAFCYFSLVSGALQSIMGSQREWVSGFVWGMSWYLYDSMLFKWSYAKEDMLMCYASAYCPSSDSLHTYPCFSFFPISRLSSQINSQSAWWAVSFSSWWKQWSRGRVQLQSARVDLLLHVWRVVRATSTAPPTRSAAQTAVDEHVKLPGTFIKVQLCYRNLFTDVPQY